MTVIWEYDMLGICKKLPLDRTKPEPGVEKNVYRFFGLSSERLSLSHAAEG